MLRRLVAQNLIGVKLDTITKHCRLNVYRSVVSHLSAGHPGAGFNIRRNNWRCADAFLQLQCTRSEAELQAEVEAEAEVLLLMICTPLAHCCMQCIFRVNGMWCCPLGQ